MNNNNFNPNQQPLAQPMPGQPNQNQPMPNQFGQNQPASNQPMPGQPMMQPVPPQRPPKQLMDPAKKKKLILGLSIGGGVLLLAIIAAILIPILLRVDYAPAYSVAKELEPKVYDIYQSYDCERIVDYVDSSYTTTKSYNEYVENCKSIYNTDVNDLVSKLEVTAAVQRNGEIKAQFDKFKAEYAQISSGSAEDLAAKLALWQARHDFVVAADDLTYRSASDAEYTAAANYLINSGNESLKAYGEGWLEKSLAVAAAYRAYDTASWRESSQYYSDYTNKKAELSDWIAANKPDINTIAPLKFSDTSKMYSEFNALYDLIAATYAANYNSGSGDCTEFLGEVICD